MTTHMSSQYTRKIKGVDRSILDAELFRLSSGFKYSYPLKFCIQIKMQQSLTTPDTHNPHTFGIMTVKWLAGACLLLRGKSTIHFWIN